MHVQELFPNSIFQTYMTPDVHLSKVHQSREPRLLNPPFQTPCANRSPRQALLQPVTI